MARRGAEPNADMWATADEPREQIVSLYRRAGPLGRTIAELPLDAVGRVPWWPPENDAVTLHRILVHMIAETERHAGQADIVRETIDGAVGVRSDNSNMASDDPAWWDAPGHPGAGGPGSRWAQRVAISG